MEGILAKKQVKRWWSGGRWTDRYFVISPDSSRLRWMIKQGATPKGELDLTADGLVVLSNTVTINSIEIKDASGRSLLVVAAESAQEQQAWLTALRLPMSTRNTDVLTPNTEEKAIENEAAPAEATSQGHDDDADAAEGLGEDGADDQEGEPEAPGAAASSAVHTDATKFSAEDAAAKVASTGGVAKRASAVMGEFSSSNTTRNKGDFSAEHAAQVIGSGSVRDRLRMFQTGAANNAQGAATNVNLEEEKAMIMSGEADEPVAEAEPEAEAEAEAAVAAAAPAPLSKRSSVRDRAAMFLNGAANNATGSKLNVDLEAEKRLFEEAAMRERAASGA